MTCKSFKTFKTKLLSFSSDDITECNCCIGEYTVDLYFTEYDIAVKIYELNDEIWSIKKFKKILIVHLQMLMLVKIIFIHSLE